MATQKNKVQWEFLLKSRDLESGLKRSKRGFEDTDRASSTLKTSMGGLTTAIGALGLAMGAREVVQFGLDAIDASKDYAEAVNAIEVTTGDASQAIVDLAETADVEFGLAKTAVLEAGVVFSGFGEKIDPDGDISDTFKKFLERATDFASVLNIDVEEALEKFKSGLAGESEPLRNFGLDMSAAAVHAWALENGVVAVGEVMSEDEKVVARYGLLMEETAKFAGDFAATSESAANKTKILNARIENAKVALGDELMPVYEDFLELSLDLVPTLGFVAKGIGAIAQSASDAFNPLEGFNDGLERANTETGLLDTAAGYLKEGLGQLAKNVVTGPVDAFGNLVGATRNLHEWLSAADEKQVRFGEHMNEAAGIAEIYDGDLDLVQTATRGVGDASSTAEPKVGDLETALSDITPEAAAAAVALGSASYWLGIFDGNLFKRGAERIAEATRVKEALQLLAGGGGSGQVADPVSGTTFERLPLPDKAAAGGPISAGTPTLVGERGPELITTNRDGFVTPNHKLGSGGGTIVNIYVDALDPDAAAVAVADALRSYEDRYGSLR